LIDFAAVRAIDDFMFQLYPAPANMQRKEGCASDISTWGWIQIPANPPTPELNKYYFLKLFPFFYYLT